ncbi:6150_t:CDS:1, partial [Paraglomus occultum]
RSLFDKLEEDYGIRDPAENLYGGVVGVPVENLYRDVIGEIKCLDLQFRYKGKWRSLDCTELIDFQIRKNPSFDLVLGQDWLWMRKAKISFGFSSETCRHHAKIVIDGMSIPLIEYNSRPTGDSFSHNASPTKNDPPMLNLLIDEITDKIEKILSDVEVNKYRKNISHASCTFSAQKIK